MESPPPTPRRTRQKQIVEQHHTLRPDQTAIEFSNAEEMIRFDAAQTLPPPALGARVRNSVNREPRVQRSWWMRLLGR